MNRRMFRLFRGEVHLISLKRLCLVMKIPRLMT